MLHITNGDSAAMTLRHAGLPGTVLAWRDVLTEGPVPDGLDTDQMLAVRARFLADAGWAAYDAVLSDFHAALATLAAAARADEEVVLWFEHDLHDQLQLVQLLTWFAEHGVAPAQISLIVLGEHPEVVPFYGLGQLTSVQLAALFPGRQTATATQVTVAQATWAAFRSPTPTMIEAVTAGATAALPFLGAALMRHLEEFPDTAAGLSRSERQILESLRNGPRAVLDVFHADMASEAAPFRGDTGLYARMMLLASAPHPLLAFATGQPAALEDHPAWARQQVRLTSMGESVLAGTHDWVRLHGIDRWLGGVHLQGADAQWRWDSATRHLVRGLPIT